MTVTSRRAVRALSALSALALVIGLGSAAFGAAEPAQAAESAHTAQPAQAAQAPGPARAAATPTPSPTPAPTLSGTVSFTVSPVSNGVVPAGEGFAASLTVDNGTDAATAAGSASLALGAQALPTRTALRAWLDDGSGVTDLAGVGQAEIATVLSGEAETAGVQIAGDDPALVGRAPGVYPLAATFASGAQTYTSRSVLVVPRTDAAAVSTGIVVPLTARPVATGLLTSDELAVLTGPGGALTDALDAVEGTPAILAVDPAVVAAIRVLGISAPAAATVWLERLQALPNSRFALQFGDADVSVQLQQGVARPLQPTTLQPYLDPANFPARSATPEPTSSPAAPSPTPSPTTTGPVLPDLDQLLDVGVARADVFWPASGTAGPEVVAALGAIGDDGASSLTLVSSASIAAGASGATVPAHLTIGAADVLAYDADVSRELSAASLLDTPALRGARLTAAAGYLAFATAETGGGSLLVSLDRSAPRSRVALAGAVDAATQFPGVAAVGLASLAGSAATAGEVIAVEPVAERLAATSALLSDEQLLARFATVLDDPTVLTGPERAQVLQLQSVSWITAEPALWQIAVDAHRQATAATLQSVQILPPTPSRLFGAGGDLRFYVRNDLPYPVHVTLSAVPENLRLDVQQSTEVTAEPDANTRVSVPVSARRGNGEVSIALELRNRTSEVVGERQSVDVEVSAEWEGIGIGALAVVVTALLAFGLVRTVLRRRAARSQTADAAALGSDDAPASGAAHE